MSKLLQNLKPGLRPLPAGLAMRDAPVLLATFLGAGRLRPASGTLGTLAAVLPGYALAWLGGLPALLAGIVLLWGAGTWAVRRYSAASGEKDDQAIVVDEAVGLWIAAIPAGTDIGFWFLAFVLFRLFDVLKPWPASFFDRRKKCASDVLLDDVVAGVYAFVGVAAAAVSEGIWS